MFKVQAFLRHRDQDMGVNRDSNLTLHGVLAGARKGTGSPVQLDPFEEQIDHPSLRVQSGHACWLRGEVIGQKRHALAGFAVDHPSQGDQVVLAGVLNPEDADLIADGAGGVVVPETGQASTQLSNVLGMRHEAGLPL